MSSRTKSDGDFSEGKGMSYPPTNVATPIIIGGIPAHVTPPATSVPDEIVQKAAEAVRQSDLECMVLSREELTRLVLEAVWPATEPTFTLGEIRELLAAIAYFDDREGGTDDLESARVMLEAEDNRRYDERDGHA